jgi:iron-sulfur cluster assembly protein
MLMLTGDAVSAIRGLTVQPEVSDSSGLRISSAAAENGSVEMVATIAGGPGEHDEIVEVGGVRVYVDPLAAPVVEDKVLDAEATDQGQIRFELITRDDGSLLDE